RLMAIPAASEPSAMEALGVERCDESSVRSDRGRMAAGATGERVTPRCAFFKCDSIDPLTAQHVPQQLPSPVDHTQPCAPAQLPHRPFTHVVRIVERLAERHHPARSQYATQL